MPSVAVAPGSRLVPPLYNLQAKAARVTVCHVCSHSHEYRGFHLTRFCCIQGIVYSCQANTRSWVGRRYTRLSKVLQGYRLWLCVQPAALSPSQGSLRRGRRYLFSFDKDARACPRPSPPLTAAEVIGFCAQHAPPFCDALLQLDTQHAVATRRDMARMNPRSACSSLLFLAAYHTLPIRRQREKSLSIFDASASQTGKSAHMARKEAC